MTLRITTWELSQKGFIRTSQIPYLLLVLALLALLFFWNTIRSKDSQLSELQQSTANEIATLEKKLQADGAALSELQNNHLALQADQKTLATDVIPTLKSNLSFSKAHNQRAKHVSDARDNLQSALQSAKHSNQKLTQQLQVLPEQKRDLSFANAANQRSEHTNAARENLMAKLQGVKRENTDLTMQLQHASAGTDSQSPRPSDELTEKLMAEIQMQKDVVDFMAARLGEHLVIIADLKRNLSFSNAGNQRAEYVKTARDNLIKQLHDTRQEHATLASQASQLPYLKRQLSMTNAENARLRHVSDARDRLMAQRQ